MIHIGTKKTAGFFITALLVTLCSVMPALARSTVLCTTFPIYQITRNIAGPDKNLSIELMLPNQMGCPHGYTLSPQDMKKITRADILVINGLGMEEFLDESVQKANPEIKIIDSSRGISPTIAYTNDNHQDHDHNKGKHKGNNDDKSRNHKNANASIPHDLEKYHENLPPGMEFDHSAIFEEMENHEAMKKKPHDHKAMHAMHEEDHNRKTSHEYHNAHEAAPHDHQTCEHHHHTGTNPHLFASPRMAAQIAMNIAAGLSKVYPESASIYFQQAATYEKTMNVLADETAALGKKLKNKRIIQPHGAFDYLARDMGIHIIDTMQPHGQKPSAAEMIHLVRRIKKRKVGAIFTEPQYPGETGQTLSKETGVPVVIIDPVATGPDNAPLDYYETTMRQNLKRIEKALGTK